MTSISGSTPAFLAGLQPLDGGKLQDVIDLDDLPFDQEDLERMIRPEETPFVRGEGDRHTVDPNDIRQGGYGSCGLLATLHSIAQQDPSVIQDMIQDNGDGTYTVTFREPVEFMGLTFWREVKVEVSGPDEKMYYQIFQTMCKIYNIAFDQTSFVHLLQKWYRRPQRTMQAVHPRDILKAVVSICRYESLEPHLSPELIDEACLSYFVN